MQKALLIGINYSLDPRSRLYGCVNDAKNMAKYLVEFQNFNRKDINIVTDENIKDMNKVSYEGIIELLYDLCISSWRDDLKLAVFQYSGHGSQIRDLNGDEEDGLDEGLVPVDYNTRGIIIDDKLNKIFMSFNPSTKIVVIVDACHSGTILDLKKADNSPNIICISGCRDSQTSLDIFDIYSRQSCGAMTSCLLKLLTDKASIYASVEELHKSLNLLLTKRGYEQRSELSSSFEICKYISLF